jgi:hypothetical protein
MSEGVRISCAVRNPSHFQYFGEHREHQRGEESVDELFHQPGSCHTASAVATYRSTSVIARSR